MHNALMRRDRDGDVVTRAATIRPNSFNREARTFAAVLATAATIQRRGHRETLDLASMVLPADAPIVLDHRAAVRDTVGRATNIRRDGDTIVAECRLSNDPALGWLVERCADGTITGISIGYTVPRWNESRSPSGEVTRTAVGAVLRHAALVTEPADDRAGIRDRTGDDRDDDRRDDDDAARNRRTRALCRTLGLSREMTDQAIDQRWSDSQILDRMMERGGRGGDVRVTGGHRTLDDPQQERDALIQGLACRIMGTEPQDAMAREAVAGSWAELHRRHLSRAGQSVTGLSDAEVIMRALTTSDMPIIAGAATNVAIRRVYDASVSPIALLFGTRELPDFRPQIEALVDWTTLGVGKVNELGEFKSSYVTESGETISIYTIGGITAVSRQLYINGGAALGNLSTAHGRRLAADVNDRMVAFITQATLAGPTMADTVAYFHASRGNIAELDITDLDSIVESAMAARAAASKRKGAGDVMIGVAPRTWIVPAEFEGDALRAIAAVNATTVEAVNPLANKLDVLAEPRLASSTTSYLVAPPAALDGLVRVGLAGAPGPYTESRWGWSTDAVEFKIRLDIGFGAVEWRSWTRLDHAEASP